MSNVKYGSIEELTADVVPSAEDQKKIDALDIIIKSNPNNLSVRMKKGFLLYQAQADGRAIKEFNEVLERDSHYIDAYVWLAELLLFHWAAAEDALPILEKAKEIASQRADIYYLLAVAFQKQNNTSQFVYYMRKAIELEPTWPNPRMCLIEYCVAAGEDNLARQQLQELEQNMPVNFPTPDDEMLLYYEELITGRVMTDYAKEWLQRLRLKLGKLP